MFVSNSSAQSMPLLTDPVKVRELESMSNKLEMSEPQQEAILEVYDRYLEDFARTRAGEIKDFEDAIASAAETVNFMAFSIPERSLVEELIRKVKRAMKAIHRSDNLFYVEVSEMLTEKQKKVLGYIRIGRELEAYDLFITQLLGQLNKGARSKMRALYERVKAEPNAEVDAALDVYDQRYLKEVKAGFDAVVESVRLALDQIDELGVRELDQQALMMRFMSDETAIDDLKRRGDILLKPLIDQAYVISQLNWKTWKKLDAMLGKEDALKLQGYYFAKSFYDATRGGKKIVNLLGRALVMPDLNEGQRIDLEEIQTTFESKWAKNTKTYADVLEKSRKVQTIGIMSGEIPTEFDVKLDKHRNDNALYIDATESKIKNVLGTHLVAMLEDDTNANKSQSISFGSTAVHASPGVEINVVSGSTEMSKEEMDALIESGEFQEGASIVVTEMSQEEMEELMESDEFQSAQLSQSRSTEGASTVVNRTVSSSDSMDTQLDESSFGETKFGSSEIPDPIAPTFSKRASIVLELENNSEMIIDSIYDDYRESFAETKKVFSLESVATQNDKSLSSGARLRKIREGTTKASEAVAQLDTSFFDDIAIITGLDRENTNLLMLEHHRQRQRTSAPEDAFGFRPGGGGGGGGGDGDIIDLVDLYVMSDESAELYAGLDDASVVAIGNAMQNYHSNVVGSHDAFVQATYGMNHLQDAMWIMDESNSQGAPAEAIQQRWRDAFLQVRDTKRELLLVNQNVMDSILKNLGTNDSWKIRMKFATKAYPDVFNKKLDATSLLSAASSIRNLDASQQSKLDALASAYKYDYWNLCENMIENYQSDANSKGGMGMMSKEDVHRRVQLETLRFERKELNDRIRMRLRMVLSKDQIKEVPGLRPSVAAANEWNDLDMQ